MSGMLSPFSVIAAVLYLMVAAAAISALIRSSHQIAWHKAAWIAVAALFVGLALIRVFAVEELARSFLRGVLQNEGAYENRRAVQGPLFAVVFATAAVILAGAVYFVANTVRGGRNVAVITAIGCAAGMMFLMVLRILSLHSVDEVLYGPLKLNWVGDIGMSLAALGCAIRYATIVKAAPPGKDVTLSRSRRR
jgi:hypothetical protein